MVSIISMNKNTFTGTREKTGDPDEPGTRRRSSVKKNNLKLERKLKKATEYLKSIGCNEIILFGSLADGKADKSSDIDLAISGISPRTYFKTVAVISSVIGWKVDLVPMDFIPVDFKEKIRKQGRSLYAG